MGYCSEQAFRSQFEFLERQFLQDGGLPFTDVLSRETVDQALDTIEFAWKSLLCACFSKSQQHLEFTCCGTPV